MTIYILAVASLVFALAVLGAIIGLIWKAARERSMERLNAFAASLPGYERVIFWRLHQDRDLWNSSRYPKAFQRWRKQQQQQPRQLRAG
jgi:hypothetical protein